ncbi:hypothetical protein LJB71_13490 [Thermomonas sp. S9]|uniref:hypothetical protein n=1 Tax=Thermomonas sp. S9 TaxID=2885203 RepID=UPI00216B63A3|nr:hypothetical protein [Thermomonas sp. S9]MCR6497138.1 hypothetical protein [Thermomonas sp. S9]
MEIEEKIRLLATLLAPLATFQPANKAELKRWNSMAFRVEQELLKQGGLASDIPHFLWHYLADADVRMKSKPYRELQQAQMEILCSRLHEGVMPSDNDLQLRKQAHTE